MQTDFINREGRWKEFLINFKTSIFADIKINIV